MMRWPFFRIRVAGREGWQVQVLEEEGTYHLILTK